MPITDVSLKLYDRFNTYLTLHSNGKLQNLRANIFHIATDTLSEILIFFTSMQRIFTIILISVTFIFFALPSASGGTGEYRLSWDVNGEGLFYRSCGLADACWVAEIRDLTNDICKAKLRCDGDKLYFTLGPDGSEDEYAASCLKTNNPHKPDRIREIFLQILQKERKL